MTVPTLLQRARWLPSSVAESPETVIMTAGIVLQFMAGHSDQYYLPVPLDRPLILLALIIALFRVRSYVNWRPTLILVLMGAMLGWVLLSMVWSGSVTSPTAVFAWSDAVGLFPFGIYLLSPVLFRTPAQRKVLYVGLTLLGVYLGAIALLEGLRLDELAWPAYINDPSSPHYDRATGPSTQAASNGMQLFGCALAAVLLSVVTSRRWVVLGSRAVAGLCLLGTFFTLTRSIWIAVAAGLAAALVVDRRSRRLLLRATLALAVVVGLLMLVPTVRDAVLGRVEDNRSAYDRLLANDAAWRIVQAEPLSGVGFHQFPAEQVNWVMQSPDYPITSTGIAVHNVVLGYAAELGLPGAALWVACLLVACIYVWRSPSDSAEVSLLGRVALAYTIAWLVVGMLVPMTYPLPATLLWLFLSLSTYPPLLGYTDRLPEGSRRLV